MNENNNKLKKKTELNVGIINTHRILFNVWAEKELETAGKRQRSEATLRKIEQILKQIN